MLYYTTTLRGGAVVARQAHNLKAVGSIPAPATNDFTGLVNASPFLLLIFNKLRLHLTTLDNSGIYWLKVDDLTLAYDLLTRNVSKV